MNAARRPVRTARRTWSLALLAVAALAAPLFAPAPAQAAPARPAALSCQKLAEAAIDYGKVYRNRNLETAARVAQATNTRSYTAQQRALFRIAAKKAYHEQMTASLRALGTARDMAAGCPAQVGMVNRYLRTLPPPVVEPARW